MGRVPVKHRRKHQQRQGRAEPEPGTSQLSPPPIRNEHEKRNRRQQQQRGVFRRQREPAEQAGCEPPALIVRLPQPDQRPHHRELEGDQRDIGRELGHAEPESEAGFRQQRHDQHVADVAHHAPDDVGEHQLHDEHREQAGKAYAEIAVAEKRSAQAYGPCDERRMIEIGEGALLPPRPVIGFIHPEIDRRSEDRAQDRKADKNNHKNEEMRDLEVVARKTGRAR